MTTRLRAGLPILCLIGDTYIRIDTYSASVEAPYLYLLPIGFYLRAPRLPYLWVAARSLHVSGGPPTTGVTVPNYF